VKPDVVIRAYRQSNAPAVEAGHTRGRSKQRHYEERHCPYMSTVSRKQIAEAVSTLPRFKLSHLNTPLEEAPKLRQAIAATVPVRPGRLGGVGSTPRLLVKRDDTTGLAFGGNKGRHFEFATAHILAGGYDVVINVNDYHSNQARFIAAACARAGLRYILVSTEKVDRPLTGNLLLCKLMGAEIHRVPAEYAEGIVQKIVGEIEAEGRRPYVLPKDQFSDLMGMFGFVETGLELEHQLQEHGVTGPVHFWGLTGRSIAGLRLYAKNRGLPWTATAVMYSPGTVDRFVEVTVNRSRAVAERLGLPQHLDENDLAVLTAYTGPAYGVPFDGVFEAIHLAARTESLILDPNYTGKSMAGLVAEVRAGRVDPEVPVVFIHSGGLPQVFAFAQELWDWKG
jgi:1-aminocyclopropane-1-carboxylate deaminase/D-cysteine desulfhydrase-like pyridoxal-dependent ACC family enzyme